MFPFALAVLSISNRGFRKGITEITPYAAIAGMYFLIRALVVDIVFIPGFPMPIFVKLLTTVVAVSDYIRLIIIPYPLSPFYPVRLYTSMFEPKVIAAISILMLLIILAVKLRKDKTMFFLLLFPFIMLAPVILNTNTFPLNPERIYIAERFLYVPVMGFSLLISAIFIKNADEKLRAYIFGGFISVLIIFSVMTIYANKTWENSHTLYSKIMQDAPDSSISHRYRAKILYDSGKLNEATEELNSAFTPSFFKVIKKSAENMPMDKKENAQQSNVYNRYGKSVNTDFMAQYSPDFAEIHFDLGRVYLAQGNIEKAARKFKVATILSPDFAEAHYNLGNVYQKQGKFDDAIKEYQAALKLKLDYAQARQNLESLKK